MTPIAVACDQCGVAAGRRCVRPSGVGLRPGEYHRVRGDAAARLDENDKELAR
jgi:hypothetical protein